MKSFSKLLIFISLICLTLLTGCKQLTRTVSTMNGADTHIEKYPINYAISSEDIKIEVTYGLNQYAKIGQDMRLRASITTMSKQFHGYVQIQVKNQNGKVNYNNKVDQNTFTEQAYNFNVPVLSENMSFSICVLDDKKMILLKEKASVKANRIYNVKYVGVFNDQLMDQEKIARGKMNLFLLTSKDVPNAFENMNLLDYIIIREDEITTLTKYQSDKLDEWTKQGGTVIVEKESYDADKDKEGTYGFGRYYYLPITEDMNVLMDNIEVKGINSRLFLSGLIDDRLKEAIQASVVSKIPSLFQYCFLFIIYVVAIGPILYIILKRQNKKVWYWRLVPMLSILFVYIVFMLGKNTRIESDYVRYMDITQIATDGYTIDTSYVAAVNVDDSSVVLQTKNDSLSPMYTIEDTFRTTNKKKQPLINFDVGDQQIKCNVQSADSFDAAYFRLSNKYQNKSVVDTNIEKTEPILCNDYKLSGTYTNTLGKDLKYAVIVSSQIIVEIGTLNKGQTINLSDCKYYYIPSSDMLYTKRFSEKLQEIIKAEDGEERNNLNFLERYDTIKVFLEHWSMENNEGNYLIGFTQENIPVLLSDFNTIRIDTGMNMLIKEITVNYKNKQGEIFDPFIDRNKTVISGEFYDELDIIDSDTLVFDYYLPKGKIERIEYSKNYNTEFFVEEYGDKNLYQGFYGTVYFYNQKTSKFEKVISSGEEMIINNLDDYLTADNVLRVRYEVAQNSISRNIITIPRLIAVRKEV